MIYKFRSKATGDLIMLAAQGDLMLRLLGREPAASGIIEPAAMPAARAALSAAAAADDRPPQDEAEDAAAAKRVGVRQRVWPMLQMLERAEAAGEPIVWGA